MSYFLTILVTINAAECQRNKLVPVNLRYSSHKQPHQSIFFSLIKLRHKMQLYTQKPQSAKSSVLMTFPWWKM